jgi:hypothetical protein
LRRESVYRAVRNGFLNVFQVNLRVYTGHAVAQSVSSRPLTAVIRVRSQISPSEICGDRSAVEMGFHPVIQVSPRQYRSTSGP